MKFRSVITIVVLFVIVIPLAAGPNPQADWSTVQSIGTGTKMRVDTRSGQSHTGNVDSVTDSLIRLTSNGGSPSIDRSEVRRVYRYESGGGSRGKSIGIWAAIGAGVGAAIGAAVLGAMGGSDETGRVIAPFILGGAGAGVAIGAALGKGEKKVLVYEAK